MAGNRITASRSTGDYLPSSYWTNAATRSIETNTNDDDNQTSDITSTRTFPLHRPATALSRTSRATTRPATRSGRRSRATTVTSIANESPNVICAICENKGVAPSVGLAFIDLTHGSVVLSQFIDNLSYFRTTHHIHMMDPSKIVFMPNAVQPETPNSLSSVIDNFFPRLRVETVEKTAWSEASGFEYIDSLAFERDVQRITLVLEGRQLAVSSFAALMKFVTRSTEVEIAPSSLRLCYLPADDTMLIDVSAVQSLELVCNLNSSKSKDHLLGLLNHTLTPMGFRLLRNNVLQPSTLPDVILARSEAVQELVTNEEMFRELRKVLKGFSDIERILARFVTIVETDDVSRMEEKMTQVLMIKSFIETTIMLHRALQSATSSVLVTQRDYCRRDITISIMRDINIVIEPDVTYAKSPLDLRNQRTFAVRARVDGKLDMTRQTYKEVTEEIHKHADSLNDLYNVSSSLKYDNGRRYWLRLKRVGDDPLPDVLINVIKKRDHIECQTLDLVKLNIRHTDLANEVLRQSDGVILALAQNIRGYAADLFRMCEAVGTVDLITSFAQLASIRDYVRPQITETLALKAARHPLIEKSLTGPFVPNDYYSSKYHRFHIVTGCNMSGKTTYIRAIALLQIMAQIGSFVPAEFASFAIVPNLFARVSAEDNSEANLSTFSVEMREMAFILRNVQPNSLIIIDELGRGTSTADGVSIAMAISEALIEKKATVWFATHFTDIAEAFANCPGVLNLQLQSQRSTDAAGLPNMTMLYTVASGVVDTSQHYGIHLAKAIGMPRSFVERAEEVAEEMRLAKQQRRMNSDTQRASQRRNLILGLHQALIQVKEAGPSGSLPGYLQRLQEEFILRMEELNI